jgi:hypothetical protein
MLLDTDGILAVSTSVGVFLCCIITISSKFIQDYGCRCSRRQCRRDAERDCRCCRCGRERAETDEDLVSTSGAAKV